MLNRIVEEVTRELVEHPFVAPNCSVGSLNLEVDVLVYDQRCQLERHCLSGYIQVALVLFAR